MGSAEAKEYVNRCVEFANLNLTKYAPMIDQLTPRAKGTVLAAWYDFYAYGEEADVDSLPKAVRPVYLAMHSDVLRARKGAATRGADDRPDTRPGRRSKPYDSGMGSGAATESVTEPLPTHNGISSGTATESATNSTNSQQAAETFRPLADVVGDVRSSQFKYKDKNKKERKIKDSYVNQPCYEVGRRVFYAECPQCGSRVVARFNDDGRASGYCSRCKGEVAVSLPANRTVGKNEDGNYVLKEKGAIERPSDSRVHGE